MDLTCANCKFYECCTGGDGDDNEAVVVSDDRYGACEGYLPDAELDLFLPDASLGGLGASWGDLMEGGAGGWDDLLDGMPDLKDILDGLPDFGSLLGPNDDGDNAIAVPVVATRTSSASGLSVLGGLVSAHDCPEGCDADLCGSFVMGTGDRKTVQDACDSGCLPVVESCDDVCGDVDGPEFLASVADMACSSCEFLRCCAGGGGDQGGAMMATIATMARSGPFSIPAKTFCPTWRASTSGPILIGTPPRCKSPPVGTRPVRGWTTWTGAGSRKRWADWPRTSTCSSTRRLPITTLPSPISTPSR